MKKSLLFLLIFCLMFSFVGCNNVDEPNGEEENIVTDEYEVSIMDSAFYVLNEPTNVTLVDDFKLVEIPEKDVKVTRVYSGSDGCGYAILVKSKDYEGDMDLMVGINNLGKVIKIAIVGFDYEKDEENSKKVIEILKQYPGKTELDDVDDFKDNKNKIDSVSGATVTSNAVYQGVYCAIEQFKTLK